MEFYIIILGIMVGVIFIMTSEIISGILISIFRGISDMSYNRQERKKNPPLQKKIYPPKAERILSLIKAGKAKDVIPCLYIENHLPLKRRLKFSNHAHKVMFLELCDTVINTDGYITDNEVITLAIESNLI